MFFFDKKKIENAYGKKSKKVLKKRKRDTRS